MKRIKKMMAVMLCVVMLIPVFSYASAETYYTISQDGILLEYYAPGGEIYIPESIDGTWIKAIADRVFENTDYTWLRTDGVMEKIGKAAFKNSKLEYACLSHAVTDIGDEAFANCKNLEVVTFESTDKIKFGKDCFKGTGYIAFEFHCSIDLTTVFDDVYAAKGDSNFEIRHWHSPMNNEQGGLICSACGEFLEPIDPIEPGAYEGFSDVPIGSWYYGYVEIASSYGILAGKGNGMFDPDANMTLAEAAKIAACIYGLEIDNPVDFGPGSPWYQPFVDYCYENDIIESGKKFDWNKMATRGEMAYLFSRAIVDTSEINPDVPFGDIPDVSADTKYGNEILSLYRKGIAAGSDNPKMAFYPNSNVKRSEAAAFVARIIFSPMKIDLAKG